MSECVQEIRRFINHSTRAPALELSVDLINTPESELAKVLQFTPRLEEPGWFSLQLATTVRRWQFPPDPFVRYEPDDEVWARSLGFGHEVEAPLRMEFCRAKVVRQDGQLLIQAMPAMMDFDYPSLSLTP